MIDRPGMRLWFWLISICFTAIGPARAAEQSAVFGNDTLLLNGVVVGEVSDQRAKFSMPAFVQALGTPNRSEEHGHTERITWDSEGVQLEATERERAPFAVLFQYAEPDATNQGIIPTEPFRGTFDCLGIKLYLGEQIADRAGILTAAGFRMDSGSSSAETWSVQLKHWAVFLRFSAAGTIDSAVIRVVPDIY